MASLRPKDTDIMSWDPENMEAYWAHCARFDKRPNETQRLLGRGSEQKDSETAFNAMFTRLKKKLD